MNTKTSRNILAGTVAGLAAIVVLMMVPTTDTAPQGPAFYGMAEVVQIGADGEVKSSQSVHNRIVDQGEELMLDALFNTGDAFNGKFGVICVGDEVTATTIDTETTGEALTDQTTILDPDGTVFGTSSEPCKTVDTVTKHGNGSATLTVSYIGGDDLEVSAGFNSVWICHAETAGQDELCAFGTDGLGTGANGDGILAAVALDAFQPVVADDTYRVSYTLDLSSPDS